MIFVRYRLITPLTSVIAHINPSQIDRQEYPGMNIPYEGHHRALINARMWHFNAENTTADLDKSALITQLADRCRSNNTLPQHQ